MTDETTSPAKNSSQTNRKSRTAAQTNEQTSPVAAPVETDRGVFKPKDVDPGQIVTVRNGFQGRLVYKSKHTGERFVWDEFGAEQDMELSELKSARSSNKKYFINNWFMFDEPWIIDYLGMNQYYKFAISIDGFDRLFERPADELSAAIANLSNGQKRSVAYRARQLIAEGAIDSNRAISTLEECLGVELVDRT